MKRTLALMSVAAVAFSSATIPTATSQPTPVTNKLSIVQLGTRSAPATARCASALRNMNCRCSSSAAQPAASMFGLRSAARDAAR